MKTRIIQITKLGAVFLVCSLGLAAIIFAAEAKRESDTPKPADTKTSFMDDISLSGPYTHENLSLYLIHSKTETKDTNEYITLDEAMEKGLVKIEETGSVGNLKIINKAKNVYIFIQSGDIVKGGKQDRTIQYDCVLTPAQKEISVNSFCVESGRWSRRDREDVREFSSSKNRVVSKKMQMATRYNGDQSEVWTEVSNSQEKLSDNIGTSVQSSRSESSLQLTLENEELQKFIRQYLDTLTPAVTEKERTIGLVVAINGQIYSADVYTSGKLFAKLRVKLLHAAATEAAADYQKDKTFEAPTIEQVGDFLAETGTKQTREVKINSDNNMIILEDKTRVIFGNGYYDTDETLVPVHRNYIQIDENERDAQNDNEHQNPQEEVQTAPPRSTPNRR